MVHEIIAAVSMSGADAAAGSGGPCGIAKAHKKGHAEHAKMGKVVQQPVRKNEGRRRTKNTSANGPSSLYSDGKFKRRFCAYYPDTAKCKRGEQCAFAHSREEFKGDLLPAEEECGTEHRTPDFYMKRYKMFWCPIGVQHDWQDCVYSHNHLDIRRNPTVGYGPRPCPNWDKENSTVGYHERCPDGERCPFSHGAKEQLYHPAFFKTQACSDVNRPEGCSRGALCAFYHNEEEMRTEAAQAEFDYSQPLPATNTEVLQKHFRTPAPIGNEQQQTRKNAKTDTRTQLPMNNQHFQLHHNQHHSQRHNQQQRQPQQQQQQPQEQQQQQQQQPFLLGMFPIFDSGDGCGQQIGAPYVMPNNSMGGGMGNQMNPIWHMSMDQMQMGQMQMGQMQMSPSMTQQGSMGGSPVDKTSDGFAMMNLDGTPPHNSMNIQTFDGTPQNGNHMQSFDATPQYAPMQAGYPSGCLNAFMLSEEKNASTPPRGPCSTAGSAILTPLHKADRWAEQMAELDAEEKISFALPTQNEEIPCMSEECQEQQMGAYIERAVLRGA